jgi:hypothetical protein
MLVLGGSRYGSPMASVVLRMRTTASPGTSYQRMCSKAYILLKLTNYQNTPLHLVRNEVALYMRFISSIADSFG